MTFERFSHVKCRGAGSWTLVPSTQGPHANGAPVPLWCSGTLALPTLQRAGVGSPKQESFPRCGLTSAHPSLRLPPAPGPGRLWPVHQQERRAGRPGILGPQGPRAFYCLRLHGSCAKKQSLAPKGYSGQVSRAGGRPFRCLFSRPHCALRDPQTHWPELSPDFTRRLASKPKGLQLPAGQRLSSSLWTPGS